MGQPELNIQPTRVSHLNDSAGGFPAHVMDGVLVTQPVGAFYLRIKHHEPLEEAETSSKLTVSYICHRQSSSVMFYKNRDMSPLAGRQRACVYLHRVPR